MKKAILSLSGGLDSTTLLAWLLQKHEYSVAGCVSFRYGSKHNQYENAAAEYIANHYQVPLQKVEIPVMAGFSSALLKSGGAIPEGHYTDKSMEQTVVPARNIIFIATLAGLAWSAEADVVVLGVHSGDHAIYPDCRPDFIVSMDVAVMHGTGGRVMLEAPFLYWDKAAIVRCGLSLGVPYELTRTCYKDQRVACGKCGSCVERLEAFRLAGAVDPLPYEG